MAARYMLNVGHFMGVALRQGLPINFSMLEQITQKLSGATTTFSATPILSVARSDITSSSNIHNAIREGQKPEGIPDELLDYIQSKELYAPTPQLAAE